jgi:hypothetical protein
VRTSDWGVIVGVCSDVLVDSSLNAVRCELLEDIYHILLSIFRLRLNQSLGGDTYSVHKLD